MKLKAFVRFGIQAFQFPALTVVVDGDALSVLVTVDKSLIVLADPVGGV
jgi:hypothetical protein